MDGYPSVYLLGVIIALNLLPYFGAINVSKVAADSTRVNCSQTPELCDCCWCGKLYARGGLENFVSTRKNRLISGSYSSVGYNGTDLREHRPYLARFQEQAHRSGARSVVQTSRFPRIPVGMFVSWGDIFEGKGIDQIDSILEGLSGNIVFPVSPYGSSDDGGSATINFQLFLERASVQQVQVVVCLRHIATNTTAISEAVSRWGRYSAVIGWYLADEPDGAGSQQGQPIGHIGPAKLRLSYLLIKRMDPERHVFISLNCLESANAYRDCTDIIMPDVYPIGIDASNCDMQSGCCGCDNCIGSVSDIVYRLHSVRAQLNEARPQATDQIYQQCNTSNDQINTDYGEYSDLWFIGQAFGRAEWWDRVPTHAEIVAMGVLAIGAGAEGLLWWLHSSSTSDLTLSAVRDLANNFSNVTQLCASHGTINLEMTPLGFQSRRELPLRLLSEVPITFHFFAWQRTSCGNNLEFYAAGILPPNTKTLRAQVTVSAETQQANTIDDANYCLQEGIQILGRDATLLWDRCTQIAMLKLNDRRQHDSHVTSFVFVISQD